MTFEIQAHRGARAFFPENTLQAFRKAADLGCRVIELDLNVSRDLRVVVSHDPWVNLPAGAEASKRFLYSMNYEEIARFDCGEPSPDFPLQQRVKAGRPQLADVFSAVEAHLCDAGRPEAMIYNLEVKSWPERDGVAHPPPEEYAALVIQEIAAAGMERRVRVQSFDARIVAEAKRIAPKLCCGLLVEDRAAFDRFPAQPGFVPEYVNPRLDLVDEALVSWLHELGTKVVVWTVNQPEEMLRLKRLGVDGLITDHPEIAFHLPGLDGA